MTADSRDPSKPSPELLMRWAIACKLLEIGKELMETLGVDAAVGVTVIVHDATLVPGQVHVAINTTLPTRVQQRIVLAETLMRSLMHDGVDADNIGDAMERELNEFLSGAPTGVKRPC